MEVVLPLVHASVSGRNIVSMGTALWAALMVALLLVCPAIML